MLGVIIAADLRADFGTDHKWFTFVVEYVETDK
jgi:hypothetical protein